MVSAAVADKNKKTLSIDQEMCNGCKICEMACSLAHDSGGINPKVAMIKIKNNS
jgi:Fe-S-cluster-containing dehydrogenase component